MPTNALLLASGLTKSYGPTHALAGVDFSIGRGEAAAVMGPSGCGKTTLLHCLAGVISPDQGQITLFAPTGPISVSGGSSEERAAIRLNHFGFVFQQGLLLPELTAVENVALPLLVGKVNRNAALTRAAELMARLGLAGLEERRPGQLSGGQQQRVAIARAQVGDPAVVFADEPTGALDSQTSSEVMDALLASTVGEGRGLVLVTHDRRVAERCHRVLDMLDGRWAPHPAPANTTPANTTLANTVQPSATQLGAGR
ncbi:MAG: ABC transporter ATP-binding protein [Microlunatus sp.]